MQRRLIQIATGLTWTILVASAARAQFQTSLQVNTQVNQGLYPTTMNPSTLRYGSQNPYNNPQLPSQNAFDIMQAGMLPSQIRAGQMAAGPMAPGGLVQVLNQQSQLQAAVAAPSAPTGPMAANMTAPQSTIRYSSASIPAPSAQDWGATPVQSTQIQLTPAY